MAGTLLTVCTGLTMAATMSTLSSTRKMGLSSLPTESMILDGFSEKYSASTKNTVVKIACASVAEPVTSGVTPTVNDVAAQRGMANSGPMVR